MSFLSPRNNFQEDIFLYLLCFAVVVLLKARTPRTIPRECPLLSYIPAEDPLPQPRPHGRQLLFFSLKSTALEVDFFKVIVDTTSVFGEYVCYC